MAIMFKPFPGSRLPVSARFLKALEVYETTEKCRLLLGRIRETVRRRADADGSAAAANTAYQSISTITAADYADCFGVDEKVAAVKIEGAAAGATGGAPSVVPANSVQVPCKLVTPVSSVASPAKRKNVSAGDQTAGSSGTGGEGDTKKHKTSGGQAATAAPERAPSPTSLNPSKRAATAAAQIRAMDVMDVDALLQHALKPSWPADGAKAAMLISAQAACHASDSAQSSKWGCGDVPAPDRKRKILSDMIGMGAGLRKHLNKLTADAILSAYGELGGHGYEIKGRGESKAAKRLTKGTLTNKLIGLVNEAGRPHQEHVPPVNTGNE